MFFQKKQELSISQRINLGFITAFILAIGSIYLVVEGKFKPDLVEQRQQQIVITQQGMMALLDAKFDQIELLAATLASIGSSLPKDEALFKEIFPPIIDHQGDKTIAGGGIWPEPQQFTPGVDRRSFFWGRNNGSLQYVDDYNKPDGNGYHNEPWYQVGHQGSAGKCSWSEAYTDPFTKTPMVTCTVPMLHQGQFSGVATIDMMLDGITSLLSQYGKENGGYAFAVDQTGQVISFPDQKVTVKPDGSMMKQNELAERLPWLSPVLTNLASVSDKNMKIALEHDGILDGPAHVDLIRLPQTGWVIGLVVPKGHMTAVANSMGLLLMLSVGASLLVMLCFGFIFFRSLLRQIKQTSHQIRNLASGGTDNNQNLIIIRDDEVGELRHAVNNYADKLKGMLHQIQAESGTLLSGATELNQFSNHFQQKAQSLRDENTMLATGAHEMGATAQEVARHANDTRSTVELIHKDVRNSGVEMAAVITAMQKLTDVILHAQKIIVQLDQDSVQVNSMLNVIRDISEQTNLLALNAAIEAARAGELGRGFAVVADEVRNLAAKSQRSAVEIEQVLARLQTASREAVSSMDLGQQETMRSVDTAQQTYQHLQGVVAAFEQISERAMQIAVAAEEQERVTHEMNAQITRLNSLTDSNADDSAHLHQMSDSIADVATRLNSLR